MSEATNDYFMEVHVKSHEAILLDNIRKLAEAYTRVTFLERAVNECRKQIDELTQQNNSSQTALQQAVNGLQAVTAERDKVTKDLEQERKDTKETINILVEKKLETERKYNDLNVSFNELKTNFDDLNSRVEGYVSDNSTLKKNYNRVLEELNKFKPQESESENNTPANNIVSLGEKKKNKKQETDGEWVDGN